MSPESTNSLRERFNGLVLHSENEARTRLVVIDEILKTVLGWTVDDIYPEEHVGEDGKTSYSDYILRTANAAIVIEAKKAGAAFNVTSDKNSRKALLTKAFLQTELGAAIVQARDYARKLSIDFAVATNGAVWAIFPAQRHDQITFHDSYALVFWSLDEILNESYQEFHGLLSRNSVISGSLESALFGRSINQIENRKLGSFFNPSSGNSRSNPVYPIIEQQVNLAFSESIAYLESDSFERCYVALPESMKFDHKIRMHVNRRFPIVSGEVLRPMKESDATKLEKKLISVGNNAKPLAILLLGTVGAGKTTFLHFIRRIKLKTVFEKSSNKPYPHWLHLDFLNNPPGSSVSDFIYSSLRAYINDDDFLSSYEKCIQHAYASDIKALKSGPLFSISKSEEKLNEKISDLILDEYSKIKPYVGKIISYATKKAPFFLIIDNVDQLESDDEQSLLFTEVLAIARSLSINLILCLRQSTFIRHRNSPSIDAFDFETVQIDPPKISTVLSKRFALVKHLSKDITGEFIAENGAKVVVDDATAIVDLLQGSVLGTEIGTRIEVLATEDVRLALRMTREFLERGYTNPGRAIEYHRLTGNYVMPKHEAFRAIMLGNNSVYSEKNSSIGNPFDSNLAVNQAQLLRLYVLSAIVSYATENNFRFVDGAIICESLRKIGFGDTYTEKILEDLCACRFIFTANHGVPTLASSFIPSRLGGYIVRDLVANFVFLENILFDTYILDSAIWSQLRGLSHDIDAERNIRMRTRLRIKRIRIFYGYMITLLSPLVEESIKRGISREWCGNVLIEKRHDFSKEISRVWRSVRRNYEKNNERKYSAPQIDEATFD